RSGVGGRVGAAAAGHPAAGVAAGDARAAAGAAAAGGAGAAAAEGRRPRLVVTERVLARAAGGVAVQAVGALGVGTGLVNGVVGGPCGVAAVVDRAAVAVALGVDEGGAAQPQRAAVAVGAQVAGAARPRRGARARDRLGRGPALQGAVTA